MESAMVLRETHRESYSFMDKTLCYNAFIFQDEDYPKNSVSVYWYGEDGYNILYMLNNNSMNVLCVLSYVWETTGCAILFSQFFFLLLFPTAVAGLAILRFLSDLLLLHFRKLVFHL